MTLIIVQDIVSPQAPSCNTAYSCASKSILTTDDVNCLGYHSCERSTISTPYAIYCYGGYACYEGIMNIYVTSSSIHNDIFCSGLYSCAMSAINNENGYVLCRGEKSCWKATIYTPILFSNTSYHTGCYGFKSCADTTFNVGIVNFHGNLAGMDCNIVSVSNVALYFQANEAGYGASITCKNGNLCNIYCYDDSCNNLTQIDATNGGIINVNCTYALKSDICPNGNERASFLYQLPSLVNLGLTPLESQIDVCNDTSTLLCDGYKNCSNSE